MEIKLNNFEQEPKLPKIEIEIILDPEKIKESEIERINWYLKNYLRYFKIGYSEYLDFPEALQPVIKEIISVVRNQNISEEEQKSEIENIVNQHQEEIILSISDETEKNIERYKQEAEDLQIIWKEVIEKTQVELKRIYKYIPNKKFNLQVTAYGTGGGSLHKDGPIYFKLPKLGTERSRERKIYGLVHEILCHGITEELRDGTALDEDPTLATQQLVKERLMDLLGRTIMINSGLITDREKIYMDTEVADTLGNEIDALYYHDPKKESENKTNLRYYGKPKELFDAVLKYFRNKNH